MVQVADCSTVSSAGETSVDIVIGLSMVRARVLVLDSVPGSFLIGMDLLRHFGFDVILT
jgi:hypothetical protein